MYQSKWRIFTNHTILVLGALFMILPVWIAFASSTHTREYIFQHGLQFSANKSFRGLRKGRVQDGNLRFFGIHLFRASPCSVGSCRPPDVDPPDAPHSAESPPVTSSFG